MPSMNTRISTAPRATTPTATEKYRYARNGSVERRPRRRSFVDLPERRTILIANRFSTSVITNSVRPTAKIVLYSIDPVGMSPMPVAAMKAVIVSVCRCGSRVMVGSRPAPITTIIVSPMAREMASTNEAMMPERPRAR